MNTAVKIEMSEAKSEHSTEGVTAAPSKFQLVAALSAFAILLGCIGWAYWPNLVEMVELWESEPDYSHGYLVLPIAIAFLWIRQDSFPSQGIQPAVVSGMILVVLSIVGRMFAASYFIGPLDTWTLLPLLAGIVLIFFGWRIAWWSLPSIFFLWFAMPLPHSVETGLRLPLQSVATNVSTGVLVALGQPAISEGNTIRIDEAVFGVNEACSGLRIFFGIAAFAFALVIISRRAWITSILLLLAVLPIALVSNATRITVTCLLYQLVGSEASKEFSHDMAGFVMIPFAGVLLCICMWILSQIFREVDGVDPQTFFQRSPQREL